LFTEERAYRHNHIFILSGIFDTLEFLSAAETEQIENQKVLESRVVILEKDNRYRFALRPLPYGCSLEIQSLDPGGGMSPETQRRLTGQIFTTLEQLIEDATEAGRTKD
jgi:hypothetical protein